MSSLVEIITGIILLPFIIFQLIFMGPIWFFLKLFYNQPSPLLET